MLRVQPLLVEPVEILPPDAVWGTKLHCSVGVTGFELGWVIPVVPGLELASKVEHFDALDALGGILVLAVGNRYPCVPAAKERPRHLPIPGIGSTELPCAHSILEMGQECVKHRLVWLDDHHACLKILPAAAPMCRNPSGVWNLKFEDGVRFLQCKHVCIEVGQQLILCEAPQVQFIEGVLPCTIWNHPCKGVTQGLNLRVSSSLETGSTLRPQIPWP
mmetsp:Transcript_140785/g.245263  ORF Transcript_140785/g.245263 Transcript_140785/m.245263 type:complete len:218 (+) Transcript_140785:42-695(+)